MIQQDEMKGGVKLSELVKHLGLAVVNKGKDFENALVGIRDVNRPGLQLVGFFDYFDERRLQVIGMAETKMLESMTTEQRTESFSRLFEYDIPALVVSRDLDIYPECLTMARKHQRTLLHTADTTVVFTTRVIEYLSLRLAPTITRHGVLLDIYGEGVMIIGDSGIGKSETAIELVKRGHRLVADDAVDIRLVSDRLLGKAPELIRHYIELRGIGVIDLQQLFGMSAVKLESQIDLVVELERWQEDKFYDRFGLDEQTVDILGIKLPIVTIPVQPGRNLAVIVEVAAMNNRAKKYGFKQVYGFASYYDYLLKELKGTVTGVGGGVGSSLGAGTERTEVKVFEAKTYIDMGIDEIDMWMNIAALKNAEFDYVLKDIQAVRAVVPKGHNLKVIIEPSILTREQVETATKLVVEGGADFVKAGTGFLGACTLDHAYLMLRAADGRIKVKCSGGVRDINVVKEMYDMGVARFGMSINSVKNIYNQLKEEE